MNKPIKPKKCKVCDTEFTPYKTFQKVCLNTSCAIEFHRQKEAEKARKVFMAETRKRKQEIKTRSEWLRDCQRWFNKYIRLRDKNDPCISCGRHHQGKYDAGHYLTAGGHPELRFNELNCHKQCVPCNQHLSGNIAAYRVNLIKKIGIDAVEWLEGPHEPKKYTIDDIKSLITTYKKKCKELENNC